MPSFICLTCGQAYTPSEEPPAHCRICEDERQYIGARGQQWTTLAELRQTHRNDIRELEPGLHGIGATPAIAIGQRALFLPQPGGGVLWDCTPLITDEAIDYVNQLGGLRAIAISHPHYYSSMVDWSEAFGRVPIYLHADDREHVTRPDPAVVHWTGETCDLGQGLTLIRCGGHFAGGAVLHWPDGAGGKGALLSGDIITVVPDTRYMSFMYSYPNLIPLPARTVRAIAAKVEPYPFDRVYAAWWERVSGEDAKARLARSVERYIAAIS
ncbi:MAG TPA: MBL fold metallo-hydrolase [Alphaproteobacteria bacterium]|nr:MBL fold metallo-hydrolase [Alphaproteobacteria bacterium]